MRIGTLALEAILWITFSILEAEANEKNLTIFNLRNSERVNDGEFKIDQFELHLNHANAILADFLHPNQECKIKMASPTRWRKEEIESILQSPYARGIFLSNENEIGQGSRPRKNAAGHWQNCILTFAKIANKDDMPEVTKCKTFCLSVNFYLDGQQQSKFPFHESLTEIGISVSSTMSKIHLNLPGCGTKISPHLIINHVESRVIRNTRTPLTIKCKSIGVPKTKLINIEKGVMTGVGLNISYYRYLPHNGMTSNGTVMYRGEKRYVRDGILYSPIYIISDYLGFDIITRNYNDIKCKVSEEYVFSCREILDNEVDLALFHATTIETLEEKGLYRDFVFYPVIPQFKIVLMCPLPPQKSQFSSILAPFSLNTWLIIFGIVGICLLLIASVNKLYEWKFGARKYKVADIIFQNYSVIWMQSHIPHDLFEGKLTMKLLLTLWLFYILFIKLIWGSDLRSAMMTIKRDSSINTIKELVKSDFSFVMSEGYQNAMAEYNKSLDQLRDEGRFEFRNPKLSYTDVVKTGTCLIGTEMSAKKDLITQQYAGKAEMAVSDEAVIFLVTGWLGTKHFEYEESFRYLLTHFVDAGIMKKLDKVHIGEALEIKEDDKLKPLKIGNFYLTFIIYSIGMFAASSAMIFEKIIKKCN